MIIPVLESEKSNINSVNKINFISVQKLDRMFCKIG